MFDLLRNLGKSEAEKRQEALSAYLDNALSDRRRQEFERLLAVDADLRQELAAQQQIRRQMQALPQRAVPRSFTLDPAVYGAPRKEPLVQVYPVLRAATALTAFFFVVALALSLYTVNGASSDMVSMAPAAQEAAPMLEAPAAANSEAAMEMDSTLQSETAVTETLPPAEAADSGMMAAGSAPAEGEAAAEEMPAAASGPADTAMIAVTPTLSPLATQAPAAVPSPKEISPTVLPTATPSELPRPELEATAVPERAATAVPERAATAVPERAATAVSERAATAVPERAATLSPASELANNADATPDAAPTPAATIGWVWVAIMLAALLIILLVVTLAARRRL
ncbi:MAG: hypothetical protein KBE23_12725 [Chloroflexi bacterium]|nr:hypothetical protein [Chloroflexota bacterium]MBP7043602.1 hypothetical protein [Chloroflexota bacterium]